MKVEQSSITLITWMYHAWCKEQGLPLMSAEDLLATDLTEAQSQWLRAFITLWDQTV